jgi:hypothetical protein
MMTALVFVAFTGVSVIGPIPLADTPVSVPITDEFHIYVVVPIVLVGVNESGVPLHISWNKDAVAFVITGRGFTVTSTRIGVPKQPLATARMLYVTVPVLTPSAAVNT